ncbi:MFS transporter [Pseudomonas sp. GCM10022188]|uniref:MFS transporter n=1 Tax=Pseudomonas TaxID=286 RepID=UPI001E6456CA|nr:MFS transporter [Pseudomonas oryzagri]MCC6077116.1 MFS transporter [Pseudomonas oryzagri]
MTEQDYLLAWAVYAVAALGCLLVGWHITGWLWRWLREPLRVVIGVLLFTPTLVEPARELYAPAIAIAALDVLFKVGSNVWRAATDLATVGMVAIALYLVFAALRWPLQRWLRQRHVAAAAEREPTMSELLEGRARSDGRIEPRA